MSRESKGYEDTNTPFNDMINFFYVIKKREGSGETNRPSPKHVHECDNRQVKL